ncbi:hypothetical protein HZB07_01555 [Candidatus Saganbacteria bacterium]|nr:hypothetical protein [Candidatus Saganbacteria bacterium]
MVVTARLKPLILAALGLTPHFGPAVAISGCSSPSETSACSSNGHKPDLEQAILAPLRQPLPGTTVPPTDQVHAGDSYIFQAHRVFSCDRAANAQLQVTLRIGTATFPMRSMGNNIYESRMTIETLWTSSSGNTPQIVVRDLVRGTMNEKSFNILPDYVNPTLRGGNNNCAPTNINSSVISITPTSPVLRRSVTITVPANIIPAGCSTAEPNIMITFPSNMSTISIMSTIGLNYSHTEIPRETGTHQVRITFGGSAPISSTFNVGGGGNTCYSTPNADREDPSPRVVLGATTRISYSVTRANCNGQPFQVDMNDREASLNSLSAFFTDPALEISSDGRTFTISGQPNGLVSLFTPVIIVHDPDRPPNSSAILRIPFPSIYPIVPQIRLQDTDINFGQDARVNLTETVAGAQYEWQVNGRPVATTSLPIYTVASLPVGDHAISVTVITASGARYPIPGAAPRLHVYPAGTRICTIRPGASTISPAAHTRGAREAVQWTFILPASTGGCPNPSRIDESSLTDLLCPVPGTPLTQISDSRAIITGYVRAARGDALLNGAGMFPALQAADGSRIGTLEVYPSFRPVEPEINPPSYVQVGRNGIYSLRNAPTGATIDWGVTTDSLPATWTEMDALSRSGTGATITYMPTTTGRVFVFARITGACPDDRYYVVMEVFAHEAPAAGSCPPNTSPVGLNVTREGLTATPSSAVMGDSNTYTFNMRWLDSCGLPVTAASLTPESRELLDDSGFSEELTGAYRVSGRIALRTAPQIYNVRLTSASGAGAIGTFYPLPGGVQIPTITLPSPAAFIDNSLPVGLNPPPAGTLTTFTFALSRGATLIETLPGTTTPNAAFSSRTAAQAGEDYFVTVTAARAGNTVSLGSRPMPIYVPRTMTP